MSILERIPIRNKSGAIFRHLSAHSWVTISGIRFAVCMYARGDWRVVEPQSGAFAAKGAANPAKAIQTAMERMTGMGESVVRRQIAKVLEIGEQNAVRDAT